MLTIRAARPEDAAPITECVSASFAHYIARMGTKPGPMLYDYARFITEDQVHVAIDEKGGVAGVLVLQAEEEGLHLKCIAVHPSCRGKGLGRTLLALTESEALRQGYSSVHLCTNEAMTENQAIYLSFGYKESGRGQEDGFARVFYRKEL